MTLLALLQYAVHIKLNFTMYELGSWLDMRTVYIVRVLLKTASLMVPVCQSCNPAFLLAK